MICRSLFALSLLISPCAFAANEKTVQTSHVLAVRDDAQLNSAISSQMAINAQRYGIAGQAVLIVKNGEIIFRGAQGKAELASDKDIRVDDIFAVYSVSKLFVSVLIMQLVEAGQLDLDKPIGRYLPDLPKTWQDIAVRHFLNHTSGVPEYYQLKDDRIEAPANKAALFGALATRPLLFKASTSTRYTQTNFVVLSSLLEAQYGKGYREIVADRIINKLKLSKTYLGLKHVPAQRRATSYRGKSGALQQDVDLVWPDYSISHAELFLSIDDLARFMTAVAAGEFVSKATLNKLWKPSVLSNGQLAGFSTGWEYEQGDALQYVGHDGGTKVRLRLLYKELGRGDYTGIIYLTTGSAKNVWSRVLVDSMMARIDPVLFSGEVLSEKLIGFSLKPATKAQSEAMFDELNQAAAYHHIPIEQRINMTGYAVLENLGALEALRIFKLNTALFPQSANVWDSLADAYRAYGDERSAQASQAKSDRLASGQGT